MFVRSLKAISLLTMTMVLGLFAPSSWGECLETDIQCQLEELLGGIANGLVDAAGGNPFTGSPDDTGGAPAGLPCRDPSLRELKKPFCFDAYFFTAHDGTKIDMTVYVPGVEQLNQAPQGIFGGSAGGSGASVERAKPRCKGCKVERKGFARDTKPRCRGCKVERSTAAGGVRFDLSGAADGLSNLGFAPLIVHSHGFGGSKASDLDVPNAQISEQAAADLWQNYGYFVVSFSERGFGTSGDIIQMMSPLKEGLDTNEVVDWSVKHLREGVENLAARFDAGGETSNDTSSEISDSDRTSASLLMGDNGRLVAGDEDPRLGSTGYSYGGHFQYTATHVPKVDPDDPTIQEFLDNPVNPYFGQQTRWDAINPQGTWFDLRHSLAHHDVVKSAWVAIMSEFALQGSNEQQIPAGGAPRQPPNAIINGLSTAATTGELSTYLAELFKFHSAVDYCDPEDNANNPDRTVVPTFHIQGFADTLFNFNEGYDHANCMSHDGANDVRFLAVLGGHLLPAISPPHHSGDIGMSLDEVVHCGYEGGVPVRYSVRQMIVDWFEEKLRFQTGADDYIPTVCMVQENLIGQTAASSLKEGSEDYTASGAPFDPTADYASRFAVEGATYPSLSGVVTGGTEYSFGGDDQDAVRILTTPALAQASFVCLHKSAGGEIIAGIPTLTLNVAQPTEAVTEPLLTALSSAGLLTGIGVSGTTDPIFFVGIGVRPGGDMDCNGDVKLTVEAGLSSGDAVLSQVFEGLSPLTDPVLTALGGDFDTGNIAELVHDQLTAIKGDRYPLELPGDTVRPNLDKEPIANPIACAAGGDCSYPWKTYNNPDAGGGNDAENVGFGCGPNKTAVDSDMDGVPDSCAEYDGFGRLAGVSRRLLPGDQVGLYFFGSSPQYVFSSDKLPDFDITVSGSVRLPIISAGVANAPDNAVTNLKYGQKAVNTQ